MSLAPSVAFGGKDLRHLIQWAQAWKKTGCTGVTTFSTRMFSLYVTQLPYSAEMHIV